MGRSRKPSKSNVLSLAKEIEQQQEVLEPQILTSPQTKSLNLLYPRTDLGNAEWFAKKFSGKIKYDHHRGRWLIYESPLWRPDQTEEIILKVKDALRHRRALAEQIADTRSRNDEINWSLASENINKINSMLKLAQSEPSIKMEGSEWDADPYLLGCPNGILNLQTGEMEKETSKTFITLSTKAKYSPDAKSNEWMKFLESVWPEPEMQDFIHKAIGYSITGDTREEVLFALFGCGANGKGTFMETLALCLGDYAHTMPFSTIDFKDKSQISNDVAALQGKRFVIASETQENIRLNEGRIKQLTGGDSITSRFLYKESFTFKPVCKIWLASNHKPRITDDTEGMWRRLLLNEMSRQFLGEDRDKGLKARLMKKENLEGILRWAVEGCLKWQQEGLEPPEKILKEIEGYRKYSNPLTEFIEDHCEVGEDLYIPTSEFLVEYREYCQQMKEKFVLSRTAFKQRLESMGFIQKHLGELRERCWTGISTKRKAESIRNNKEKKPTIH